MRVLLFWRLSACFAVSVFVLVGVARGQESTSLHLAASESADAELIESLIDEVGDINALDRRRWTALHYASASDQSGDIINLLFMHGASINALTMEGYTPLHVAAMSRNMMGYTALIELGADVAVVDKAGKTPSEYLP